MTDRRTTGSVAPPPPSLVRAATPDPRVTTLAPEIRSDAGLTFDPADIPYALAHIRSTKQPPLILWRVELGWREADKVQDWLIGPPAGGRFATREDALRDFIETVMVAGDPPAPFLDYRGAFLSTETSHAHYCFILAMTTPVPWPEYQRAWPAALDRLGLPNDPWRQELTGFLQQTAGLATSNVEVLRPAAEVGDLRGVDANGQPRYPVIRVLLG